MTDRPANSPRGLDPHSYSESNSTQLPVSEAILIAIHQNWKAYICIPMNGDPGSLSGSVNQGGSPSVISSTPKKRRAIGVGSPGSARLFLSSNSETGLMLLQ